jgi:hypothetical protein
VHIEIESWILTFYFLFFYFSFEGNFGLVIAIVLLQEMFKTHKTHDQFHHPIFNLFWVLLDKPQLS